MNREIKFRAWTQGSMWEVKELAFTEYKPYELKGLDVLMENNGCEFRDWLKNVELMQYAGLKDKNGKEIYELMELDGKYEIEWLKGRYILREISSGDIIDLNYENQYEITREYTKI